MDNITKEIIKDLGRYGWQTKRYDKYKIVLVSDTSIEPQTICINSSGIELNNVKRLSNEENTLVYRLKNKWEDDEELY